MPLIEKHMPPLSFLRQKNTLGTSFEFSTILFGIYTLIIPINQVMNFSGSGTINKYLGILIIIFVLIDMLIRKRGLKIKREFLFLYLFIILVVSSYFWSVNQERTISGTISLISLALFYILCSNRYYSDLEKSFIRLCSVMGGIIVSMYLISTKDLYLSRVTISTSIGHVADPNGLAASISFGTIFLVDIFLGSKKKINSLILPIGLIIMLYGILLTGSRGGIIGLVFGLFSLILFRIWKKNISKLNAWLLGLSVLGLIFFGSGVLNRFVGTEILARMSINNLLETGGTGRLLIWSEAIEIFFKRPLFGYGFNAGPDALQKYFGTFIGTHNDILFLLIGTGIIGFILFASFFVAAVTRCVRNRDTLTLSMILMLIAFGFSLDFLLNKNYWNVMIYSQIGMGITGSIKVIDYSGIVKKVKKNRYPMKGFN